MTGHDVTNPGKDDLVYVGTLQDGPFVWHLFERGGTLMAGRKNEPHATELLPPSERLPKLEAELEQANFAIEKFHDQLSALYRTLKENR